MTERKIVLFGGTFDPVHLGHTCVAACTAEFIGAEKVVFIPAKRSPLKNLFPKAGDNDRLNMIALAIADNKNLQLSDCELKKPGPGYTLETVRCLQAEYGSSTSIYWLVGADSIDELPYWYGITSLIDECNLSVMCRAGYPFPDFAEFKPLWGVSRVEKLQQCVIETPLIEISSTEIRNRIAAGGDVSGMLHPAVAEYVREHNLYK
mgnify:CR=1 FL=1